MTETTADTLEAFMSGVPGIYTGIASADYHRSPAIGSTTLKAIHGSSPKHARHKLDNPAEPSEEMIIGSLAHCLLFTPRDYPNEYIVALKCAASTKDGKPCRNDGRTFDGEWYCGLHDKGKTHYAGGRQMVTTEQVDRAESIYEAVKAHPVASQLLDHATDRELSILWTDDETGVLCKCRLDVACRGLGIFPDLKTCASAKPSKFQRQAFDLGYHIQLAHYRRGAMVAGVAVDLPNIIAVENTPPHDVVVFEPSDEFMEAGIRDWRAAMNLYDQCASSGEWRGYGAASTLKLELPKWA
jgi:exodeoxyribonuclease VIII